MNKSIKQLYAVIKDNKILVCESNLKDLVNNLPAAISGIRVYDYYRRQFLKSDYFVLEFNREYIFQKIVY